MMMMKIVMMMPLKKVQNLNKNLNQREKTKKLKNQKVPKKNLSAKISDLIYDL